MVTFYVCTIVQRLIARTLRIATTQLGNRPATRITVVYAYGLVYERASTEMTDNTEWLGRIPFRAGNYMHPRPR